MLHCDFVLLQLKSRCWAWQQHQDLLLLPLVTMKKMLCMALGALARLPADNKNISSGTFLFSVVTAQEPLLGMAAAPGSAAAANGDGDEEGDETEPLPGDVHYPWLERKMQTAYTLLVSGSGVFADCE
jgi:hypothetical protein